MFEIGDAFQSRRPRETCEDRRGSYETSLLDESSVGQVWSVKASHRNSNIIINTYLYIEAYMAIYISSIYYI